MQAAGIDRDVAPGIVPNEADASLFFAGTASLQRPGWPEGRLGMQGEQPPVTLRHRLITFFFFSFFMRFLAQPVCSKWQLSITYGQPSPRPVPASGHSGRPRSEVTEQTEQRLDPCKFFDVVIRLCRAGVDVG